MLPAVAYSTPEGEMAAWAFGIRIAGFPGMTMWEALSGQKTICRDKVPDPFAPGVLQSHGTTHSLETTLHGHGDNAAAISGAILGKKKTPACDTWVERMG